MNRFKAPTGGEIAARATTSSFWKPLTDEQRKTGARRSEQTKRDKRMRSKITLPQSYCDPCLPKEEDTP